MKTASLVLIMLTLPLVSGAPFGSTNPPQEVFNVITTITVGSDGSAFFDVYFELRGGIYADQLSQSQNQEEYLRNLAEELVYKNLILNLQERYGNFTVYLPPEGPVEVTGTRKGSVRFTIVPFLIPGKRGLECPYSGPLDFIERGKVYGFSMERLILVLPKNSTVVYAFPEPDQKSGNVMIWEDVTFIPMIAIGSVEKNETLEEGTCRPLEANLSYSPAEGKVFVSASFLCSGGTPVIPGLKNGTIERRGNLTVVKGYMIPEVEYNEGLLGKEWRAIVKLPPGFEKINGGEVENESVVIDFKKGSPLKPTALGIVIIGAGVIAAWRWRR